VRRSRRRPDSRPLQAANRHGAPGGPRRQRADRDGNPCQFRWLCWGGRPSPTRHGRSAFMVAAGHLRDRHKGEGGHPVPGAGASRLGCRRSARRTRTGAAADAGVRYILAMPRRRRWYDFALAGSAAGARTASRCPLRTYAVQPIPQGPERCTQTRVLRWRRTPFGVIRVCRADHIPRAHNPGSWSKICAVHDGGVGLANSLR